MNYEEYKVIFDTYYAEVFSMCLKITKHHQEAQDITIVSFTKLWKQHVKVAPTKAKAFLMITAKNSCIDYCRRKKRLLEFTGEIEETIEHAEIETSVIAALYKAMRTLSPQQKTIFKLKFVDGLNGIKIGEKLNIDPSTVRSQIFNGLKKLRKVFKQ